MATESPLKKRRRLALKRGTTHLANDFSYICKRKPDRVGIVAEGDSWFAYPRKWIAFGADINIVHHLEEKVAGTDTVNLLRLAYVGDEAVDMTVGKQFKNLYKVLKKNRKYVKFLMFSGGGNDIVGKDDMPPLLKDYEKGYDFKDCIHLQRFEHKLDAIILAYRRLVQLCEDVVPKVKIITHTYDIAQPWNQGAEFFWGLIKTKPWVYPYMKKRNIPPELHLPIIEYMLVEFANRLKGLSKEPDIADRLIVVDTQGTLKIGSKKDWLNEIHPTSSGFNKVYKKIYKEMRRLDSNLPK